MSKETLVNKSETFEDWRLKTNEVSLDLGSIASNRTYTAASLDTESRLTDQYITRDDLGDGGLYIRDVSNLPGGLEIDYSADRSVDNTDGYLILNAGSTTRFPSGTLIAQYANNSTSSTPLFSATVVSCSNKKILLSNIGGTEGFNPTLNLYDADEVTAFIAASYLKEIIVESYHHGNVRVYRSRNYQFAGNVITGQTVNALILSDDTYHTIQHNEKVTYTTPETGGIYGSPGDVTTFYVIKPKSYTSTEIFLSLTFNGSAETLAAGSGTQSLSTSRVALPQNMNQNGFHIAPQRHYVSTNASSIPATFVEGEVLYQGTQGSETFKGVLYTADISGVLIFKSILEGSFDSSEDLISTTNNSDLIANANLTSNIITADPTIGQMIEFNTPAAAGDDYKVYFGSAVDAVLELQDDVGTVENLQTNNSTDLTVAINELELGLRGTRNNLVATDLATPMSANDVVSALLEHEADLFGAEGASKRTLTSLLTNDQASIVDSINELETAIRGNSSALVATDLGSTSGHPAMDADDLVAAVLEHEVDLYGTGSQTLSSLATNNQSNFVASINELETAIRGTNAGLVLTDLGVTLAPYNNSAVNLVDHNEELQRDIGDVTNAKLGVLNTPDVSLTTSGLTSSATNILTMSSNPIDAGIKVGMFLSGHDTIIDESTGGGSFVTAVSATNVTISRPLLQDLADNASITFKVEDLVTKIKGLDDSLGALDAISTSPFHADITYNKSTFKDTINSITTAIGNADIGTVINSGESDAETLTSALLRLRTDIGDVGDSGANISAGNYTNSTTDLTSSVLAAAVAMTGNVEFITAFDAGGVGSLAEKAGYSATDLHAAIRELQTYVGDASTLSNSGDTYTVNSHGSETGTGTTTLNLVSAADVAVDVGYEVTGTGITGTATIVEKLSSTSFVLNATHTVGTGVTITFTEPTGYGFADDVVTNALIELRTALVGGTADLTDKVNTLDDSDGASTDFNSTNIVDAIRELQDDLGQQSLITQSPFHGDLHGNYSSSTFKDAINSITAAIGAVDIGDVIDSGDETLTNAIAQLRTDIGDVGTSGASLDTTATDITGAINELEDDLYTSTTGSFTGLTSTNFQDAIEENVAELGDVTTIATNDYGASGYVATTAVTGIQELQADVANPTEARMGTNTTRAVTTVGATSNNTITVASGDTVGLVPGMTATHANITSNQTIVSTTATTITLSAAVDSEISDASTVTFKAENLSVKTLALDTNTGDVSTVNDATGYTNTTLVGAITEIQTDIGDTTASNMGTTSSTLVTAIKEIIDGTGQADVTVGATVISRDNANGGFLKKVKGGSGADAQTIVSNLNFNSAGTVGDANKTTFTFGQNTVLDLSAATLITEAANADFTTTAKKIVFSSTVKDGQGIEIDRDAGPIVDAIGNTSIDPSLLWVDQEVTAIDDTNPPFNVGTVGGVTTGDDVISLTSAAGVEIGMVVYENSGGIIPDGTTVIGINQNDITISNTIQSSLPGLNVFFRRHNRSDLAWKVKGFKPSTNPSAADAGYETSNLDFYNAGRLFDRGTSGLDNTENGVIVTWDPVNQHFNTTLETISGVSGTVGSNTRVPVITVDSFGRITNVTTSAIINALGTFKLQASGVSNQVVIGTEDIIDIKGTANQIETDLTFQATGAGTFNNVTVGLTDDVEINETLTVSGTDTSTSSSTGALLVAGGAGIAENLNVGGDLNVGGSISSATGSFSFSTTSATVSSQQIILNALSTVATTETPASTGQAYIPAASFVAHRGFQSTPIAGAIGDLIVGKRYQIISSAASAAITSDEQVALRTVSGADSETDYSNNEIFTAVVTGDTDLGGFTNITLREQNIEAKIAWNEGTDQWELYRGSETSNGAIVAQGDTFTGRLARNTQFDLTGSSVSENHNLTMVSSTGETSDLYEAQRLVFNPVRSDLKLNGKMAIGATGAVDGQSFYYPEAHLHIKTNVDNEDAKIIVESNHDNDSPNSNAVVRLYQGGRNVSGSLRLTGVNDTSVTGGRDNTLLLDSSSHSSTGSESGSIQFATGGTITHEDSLTTIPLDSTSEWLGFRNIFYIDEESETGQGNYAFGYDPMDGVTYQDKIMSDPIRSTQKISFDDNTGIVSLASNTIMYTVGLYTTPNNPSTDIGKNADETDGGAYAEVISFLEDENWRGRTIYMSGQIDPGVYDSNNMHERYIVEAFIKYIIKSDLGNGQFNYSEGPKSSVNLRTGLDNNGNFSLAFAVPTNNTVQSHQTILPQMGFSVKGINAKPGTIQADGDLDIKNLSATYSALTIGDEADIALNNPTITTSPIVRMTIDGETGNIGVGHTNPLSKLDVHGNFRVEGDQTSSFPVDAGVDNDQAHTAVFAPNDLSQYNTLDSAIGSQLKQAVFVSRGALGGDLSYLDITDVRTVNSDDTIQGSSKRIQHRVSGSQTSQGILSGFVSFPGAGNLVEIGGVHSSVDKVGISTNSGGPTQIFHNIAAATSSSKKLETNSGGVTITGDLTSDTGTIGGIKFSAENANENFIAFKGTTGDDDNGGYTHTFIGERIYDGTEKSELLFFKGDDDHTGVLGAPSQPDRIRHFSGQHVFDVFNTDTSGSFDEVGSSSNATRAMTINPDGKIAINTSNVADLSYQSNWPLGSALTIHDNNSFSPIGSQATLHLVNTQTPSTAFGSSPAIQFSAMHNWSDGNNAHSNPGYIGGPYIRAYKDSVEDDNYSMGLKFGTHKQDFIEPRFALVIDSDQKVGIGTETPTTPLDVSGTVNSTAVTTGTIDTTGDIRIGNGTMNGSLFTGEINAVDTGINNQNNRHIYINAGESWALSDNADRIADQNTEKVYINAEYGLEVTSHPENWLALNGATAGWAGKNNPVKINQADGSSEFNKISHTGLQMTSGTDIDQLYTYTLPTPAENTDWQYTGITSDDLSTGTYMVQLYIQENGTGGQFDEIYSGTMSWWAGATAANESDEIFLHNAGSESFSDGADKKNWGLRTQRTSLAGVFVQRELALQIRSTYTTRPAGATYTIKLRRMI